MLYRELSDNDISSLKRDVEDSLRVISDFSSIVSSLKWDVDSQVREFKSSQSTLERAVDEKIRDIQRSAGKTSSYSSYSYSSADSKIRDAQRGMEKSIVKLADAFSKIASLKDKAVSAQREVPMKFQRLGEAYRQKLKDLDAVKKEVERAKKEFEGAKKDLERVRRETENLTEENKELQSCALDRERKMRAALDAANSRVATVGVAATAALSGIARELKSDKSEPVVSELKKKYEQKILSLQTALANKVKENKALREKLGTKPSGTVGGKYCLYGVVFFLLTFIGGYCISQFCGGPESPKGVTRQASYRRMASAKVSESSPSKNKPKTVTTNPIVEDAYEDADDVADENDDDVPSGGDGVRPGSLQEGLKGSEKKAEGIGKFFGCEIGSVVTDKGDDSKTVNGVLICKKAVKFKHPFRACKTRYCYYTPNESALFMVRLESDVFVKPNVAKMRDRLKEMTDALCSKYEGRLEMHETADGYRGRFNGNEGLDLTIEIVDGFTSKGKLGKKIKIILVDNCTCPNSESSID